MKKFFILAAALSLGLASCSNEENPNKVDPVSGETGPVVFRISAPGAGAATRAAEGTEDAIEEEMTLNFEQGLTVAVFTPQGMLEYAGELTLEETGEEGVYETPLMEAVMLPTGKHYFFVFANNDDNEIKLDALYEDPTAAEPELLVGDNLLDTWMAKEFGVTFDGDIPSIAVDGEFLLGTLWKEAITAPAGGSQEEPEYVELEVGRLSSKIILNSVEEEPGDGSILKGTFGSPEYRLGTVSRGMYNAGVMKNAAHLDPFTANREVTSAKHKSPYLEEDSEPTEKVFNVTDFVQYYSFMPVAPAAADAIDWFYAVENTTELQPLGEIKAQFYGNTTYIQIETVYTPDHTEVYDFVKNLVTNKYEMKLLAATEGTPWTGTFWSYGTGAARVLLNEDPKSDEADPQIIADLVDLATAEILEYKDGKNYHKFPVQDPGETAGLYKNRVLRNHYYSYDVEGIVDLGSNTSDVDPTEPIEGETWLRIKVEVAPWDKVTNGSIVL